MTDWTIIQEDCSKVMAKMEDHSFHAIITDPPYYKVKRDDWDNQWNSPEEFMAWMENLAANHWKRLLKPNGSLLVFASPSMASHVEVMLSKHFEILNHIVWAKNYPGAKNVLSRRSDKSTLRSFFSDSERIIFAEHKGVDPWIKGNGAGAFTPILRYLEGAREAAGVSKAGLAKLWRDKHGGGGGMVNHWFGQSQWFMPLEEHYLWLQEVLSPHLTRTYDDLRREFEECRRTFQVDKTNYSDVWYFNTINGAKDKHPCEKPVDLMRHIVESVTQEGDKVLDCFSGSGATGEACFLGGRSFVGVEADPVYAEGSVKRLTALEDLYALVGRG